MKKLILLALGIALLTGCTAPGKGMKCGICQDVIGEHQ